MNQEFLITQSKDRRSDAPVRLITNRPQFILAPGIEVIEAQGELRDLIAQLLGYIEKASKKKEGTRGCPFLPLVVEKNGLYLSALGEDPSHGAFDLTLVFQKLLEDFTSISPSKTEKGMPFDPTVILSPFTHVNANTESFVRALEAEHAVQRSAFIRRGLMVGHMTPFHEGGSESLFHADILFLSVRRMSERDEGFMGTDLDKAVFAAIYSTTEPPMPEASTCPKTNCAPRLKNSISMLL